MKIDAFAPLLTSFVLTLGCSGSDAGDFQEGIGNYEQAQLSLLCRSDADCPASAYCTTPPRKCGGAALCRPRPELCPELYEPVCGCDGETYANACAAAAAGASVHSQGVCPDLTCGGVAGLACPGLGRCADDLSDECDPAQGGVDCGGRCECAEYAPCADGYHFDSSASVCACAPN